MATPFVVADAAVAVAADLKQYDADLRKAESTGTATGSRLANALKRDFGTSAKVMAGGAAVLFGALLKGGNDAANAMANYRRETGATGAEAEEAEKSIHELFKTNLEGYEAISGVLAKVHNDLGLTGQAAKAAAQLILDYARATGQDAVQAVSTLDDLTDTFNLDAAAQQDILDKLVKSHQTYGGSVTDNQAALIAMAPALKAANLSYDDGIGLLNLFAKSGVDASVASTALTKALAKVKSPEELQRLIADIQATEDPLERAQKASDLFGVKAGTKLAQALSAGSQGLGEFAISSDDAAGATKRAADEIDNLPLNQLKLGLKQVLGPLAELGAGAQPFLLTLSIIPGAIGAVVAAKNLLTLSNIKEAASWLLALPAMIANNAALLLYDAAALPAAIATGLLTAATTAWSIVAGVATAATTALGIAVNFLLSPIGLIILAVGALFIAWQTNFLGIRDIVGTVIDALLEFFKPVLAGIEVLSKALGAVLDFIGDVVDGIHDFLFGSEEAVEKSSGRMKRATRSLRDDVAADLRPPAIRDDWRTEMDGVVATVNDAAPQMAAAAQSLADEIPTGMEKSQASAAARVKQWLSMTIGQQLVAMGPEVIRRSAQISLDIASGIRDKRSAIDAAMEQLKKDMLNPLSRSKEVAHDIALLFGKRIAKGLKSSDPVIKAQAEGTRALIEAQLIETVKAGGEAGKKIQAELEAKLKSKDPAVKAQAQRTKSLIDEALKAQPANTPGEAIGNQLNKDLGNKSSVLGATAYRIGKNIFANLYAGVTGGARVSTSTVTSGRYAGKPLPEFGSGTDYVPYDMLAMVHKGEIIHSPEESERIRQGLAGERGGDTYTNTWVMPEPTRDPWEVLEATSRYARWGRLRAEPSSG